MSTATAEPPASRSPAKGRGKRRGANSAALHAARREAAENRQSLPLGVDPVDALQEVLDTVVADLRFAQARADRLTEDDLWRDTMAGRIPNEWIRLRDDVADRVERVANNMVRNGLMDRAVRVEEARAALMVEAIRAAAEKAGLDRSQVAALGRALRDEIQSRTAELPETT